MSGLASPPSADSSAALIFRAALGAVGLGTAAWVGARPLALGPRRAVTIAALVLGIAIAPLWRTVGVEYFDNVRIWLQEGSTLTLIGGLRGLAVRRTLWLVLLGGSLATAAGKHIPVDLLFRLLPRRSASPRPS